MNNPVISVLILAWNDEKYIEKCLDSVLSQTFTNFEVIIVDDGSTDFSGKICDEYENKNARIQVFHKRNEGISASRNFLLKKAKGKYIKFVDSDDWIESKTLEIMYNAAVESPAELVQCNLVLVEKRKKY